MTSNKLRHFALQCVSQYATFNKLDGFYTLDTTNIPDIVLNEFCSLILSQDNNLSSEATGFDNPLYESKMVPALIRYLKNSSDRDEEIEFKNTWTNGITSYFDPMMQDLINDALAEYNYDYKFAQNF